LVISYESDNDVARQLYKSIGFVETDEKDGEVLGAKAHIPLF